MSGRTQVPMIAMCAAAAVLPPLVPRAAPPVLLQNVSPSLPIGLYRMSAEPPAPEAIVAICQPEGSRAYLAGLGYQRSTLLLKRVVAAGGARVCAGGRTVEIDGWTYLRRTHDRSGAPLPTWGGCRTLAADELFLVGDSPESFDSRYFGPVRRAAVVGVYRRLG